MAGLRELLPSLEGCYCLRLLAGLAETFRCCFAVAKPGSGSCFLRSIAVLVYDSKGHVSLAGRASSNLQVGAKSASFPRQLVSFTIHQKATLEIHQIEGLWLAGLAETFT